jgi:hypothetical protein
MNEIEEEYSSDIMQELHERHEGSWEKYFKYHWEISLQVNYENLKKIDELEWALSEQKRHVQFLEKK